MMIESNEIYETIHFKNDNFTYAEAAEATFTHCQFDNCDFTGAELMESSFESCTFRECNFSLVQLKGARLNKVIFENSKVMGIHFNLCSHFALGFDFKACHVQSCIFMELALRQISFQECQIVDCDFYKTDLTQANFNRAVFQGAIFEQTVLVKADFREAVGYNINPNNNKVKKAKFSLPEVVTLLDHLDIVID